MSNECMFVEQTQNKINFTCSIQAHHPSLSGSPLTVYDSTCLQNIYQGDTRLGHEFGTCHDWDLELSYAPSIIKCISGLTAALSKILHRAISRKEGVQSLFSNSSTFKSRNSFAIHSLVLGGGGKGAILPCDFFLSSWKGPSDFWSLDGKVMNINIRNP